MLEALQQRRRGSVTLQDMGASQDLVEVSRLDENLRESITATHKTRGALLIRSSPLYMAETTLERKESWGKGEGR